MARDEVPVFWSGVHAHDLYINPRLSHKRVQECADIWNGGWTLAKAAQMMGERGFSNDERAAGLALANKLEAARKAKLGSEGRLYLGGE
jgi:hypothetical protein